MRFALVGGLVLTLGCQLPALASFDPSGNAPFDYLRDGEILKVQALLSEKGFYRGPIDGWSNEQLEKAILAFHKAADRERTTLWGPDDFTLLSIWEPEVPYLPGQPDRIEIDIERQVMHLVEDGRVVATLGVSSANGAPYLSGRPGVGWAIATTPRGSFTIERHIPGWRYAALGVLYKPWYFYHGYAIHGSPSVPAYPASHGCVRVTYQDADWLSERLAIGLPVNVRDTIPRSDPMLVLLSQPFGDLLGVYS